MRTCLRAAASEKTDCPAWSPARAILAAALLWGVGAFEPAPCFAAVALLVGLSLSACALPALQAMRVAPAVVLRDEA